MAVTLYTIDCFNCKRLEKKLEQAHIQYNVCKNQDTMSKLGMSHMPVLQVDNTYLDFKDAIQWVNNFTRGD